MQTGREHRRGPALAAPRTSAAVPGRPARPTLTLKGKTPPPPQPVPPEQPAAEPDAKADASAIVPASTSTTSTPAAVVDEPAKPARAFRPWTRSRDAVTARPALLARAQALNALLVAPIGVLPAAVSDALRPFRIGLGGEIVARRKPEVVEATCERAIRNYVRSFGYRLAVAQPGSMRHDLDGNPVEPVSETDRQQAQRSCEVNQEKGRQRKAAAASAWVKQP